MGRPSTPILSLDIIADAAVAQVDETGRLEMIRLAARLGVVPSSLYHHVKNRTALIEAMRAERLTEEVMRSAPPAETWQEQLRQTVTALSQSWRAHPKLALMFFTTRVSDDTALLAYDDILAGLYDIGLPPSGGIRVLTLFEAISSGLAFDGLVPLESWQPRSDLAVPHLRAALEAGSWEDRHQEVVTLACDMLIATVEREIAAR